jgi:hypothetical protein
LKKEAKTFTTALAAERRDKSFLVLFSKQNRFPDVTNPAYGQSP